VRFYQLVERGIFPKPVYCVRTKRLLYTQDLQQRCLEIRKTGIGDNDQPMVFYTPRKEKTTKSRKWYEEIVEAVKQVGMTVTDKDVKDALDALGLDKATRHTVGGELIGDVCRYFQQRCQNGV
jgi:hypothetical protein